MTRLPIGAFARLARLTVKALRHYDAEGLLRPAEVDPRSGYRYYRADQVTAATTIALLRGLDVPLPVVRQILTAPDADTIAAVLAAQRDRMRSELAQREASLRSLEVLLREPALVRYDVSIAERAPVRLAGERATLRADDLDEGTAALCRLAPLSREPLVGVFPLDLVEEVEVTVGVPAPDGELALPGGLWASTLHAGPYPELPMAYAALLEHVRGHGHDPAGPVTETYLSAPHDPVTRVAVKLA